MGLRGPEPPLYAREGTPAQHPPRNQGKSVLFRNGCKSVTHGGRRREGEGKLSTMRTVLKIR